MRKGKVYRMLQPSCLAPDMPLYGGLPRFATFHLVLAIEGGFTDFDADKFHVFPEVIPNTWEVRYHFQATAGLFSFDGNLKVFPRPTGPGVRVLMGGILNDGSTAAVEGLWQWDFSDTFQYGLVGVTAPFVAEHYDGVITGCSGWRLEYVRYRDEP